MTSSSPFLYKMKRIITVSQLNAYIKNRFDADLALKSIYIKGEVSNCKYHSSGHIYFSLKDAKASIRCVMFASYVRNGLKFRLENGQMVLAGGYVSVFERDGGYQLYVQDVQPDGIGNLYLQFEQLKKELSLLGYFDPERKKSLPLYPKRIGIVTASTGAAIQDIISVAKRRNPYVSLFLYPATVQGVNAGKSIAEGIKKLDACGMDAIIIGRGGGSIEDLWPFNERVVADAIIQCNTPIVSGTGHETDVTISDLCADLRAATPTAAAEILIPDVFALMQQLDHYRDLLDGRMIAAIESTGNRIRSYERQIRQMHPGTRLKLQQERLFHMEQILQERILGKLKDTKNTYTIYLSRLEALSPLKKLGGGYAYIADENGKGICSVTEINEDSVIDITFRDGTAKAKVISVDHNK